MENIYKNTDRLFESSRLRSCMFHLRTKGYVKKLKGDKRNRSQAPIIKDSNIINWDKDSIDMSGRIYKQNAIANDAYKIYEEEQCTSTYVF